jgi:hypothetical protein
MRYTALIIATLLLHLALPGPAAARSLLIRSFDADIRVLPNGRIEVTEAIRVRFDGSWNGVFRDLSLRHTTARGRSERLDVDVVSVADAAGTPLKYETSRKDSWTRRLQVWVPNATDVERTIVIRYRVRNALRFFEEESDVGALDELYWNVTGTDWEMPIERVNARIVLPDGVGPVQTAAYTGYVNSTASDAEVRTDGNVVTVRTTRQLATGEGLTVGVGWAPGAVERPSAVTGIVSEVQRNWPVGLPILAFLFAFRSWRRKGKDPDAQSINVQYEPPDAMTPAELGTLLDHKAEMHDITATLVDLAVRGYLLIEEKTEKKMLGLLSDTDYVFYLRRPRSAWNELRSHEQRFLEALFKKGTRAVAPARAAATGAARPVENLDASRMQFAPATYRAEHGGPSTAVECVKLSDLKDSFYTSLSGIRRAIYDQLVAHGYYRHSADKVKAIWTGAGMAAFAAGAGAIAVITDGGLLGLDPIPVGIGAGLSAVILLGFGQIMPARTVKGARARERALGFREFLDKVETDRYRRMITSPEMFERYLPYAMAFRVADRWARAFEALYSQPPDWYHGSHGSSFRTSSFTNSMSRMSSSASTAMASSPKSSGSGGGGSSGGGSGGGGGGGF